MSFRPLVARPRVFHPESDVMVTKQSMKDECDINKILNQYKQTGILTHVQSVRPTYTDLPDTLDYQDAMSIVMDAEEAFMDLPAKVRDHFSNDPARFLAAFGDPAQVPQLREFGLLKPEDKAPPAPPAKEPAAGS